MSRVADTSWRTKLAAKRRYLNHAHRHHGVKGVVNNLLNDATSKLQPERVAARPLRLVIEPTVRCNLNCTFCETNTVFKERVKKHLTPDEFRKLLDRLPFVQSINPTLRGEALASPHIYEMLQIARERGIRVRLVTNGQLLAIPEKRRKLLEVGVEQVVVSVDRVGKRYNELRVGGDFDALAAAIQSLQREAAERHGQPRITVAVVGDGEHPQDPLDVIAWAASLGIPEIDLQPIHNWGDSSYQVRSLSAADIAACRKLAMIHAIRLNVYEPSAGDPLRRRCTFPWDTVVVASDGRVTPCCVFGTDPDRLSFGNLLEQSFEEIWNGPAMRRFRRELKSTECVPDFCKGCPNY